MLLDNHHGPDRRIDMEVEMLREAGAEVRVIAWDRRPPDARAAAAGSPWRGAPVDLVRIPLAAPPTGGLAAIRRAATFSARVWRAHRRLLRGAQVIVANDLYLLPLGWALSLRTGLPLVYDAHEEFAAMEGGRYPDWLLRAVTLVETLMARRAAVVVVPGETRVPRWRQAGIDPVVLPNVGRRVARLDPPEPVWDLAYVGGLEGTRRLDLLVELARARPDLRIAVAGEGRYEDMVTQAASELTNFEFHGETSAPDDFLARSRAIYYGMEPSHPYTPKACPNTLYQAVRVGRPIVYFGGGEIERFLDSFRVGMEVDPDPRALASAIDRLPECAWQFDEAWGRLEENRASGAYAHAVLEAARR
jgi:Glycosyl transferase 4-like domain/Glycosyl transferases group 1